jgi:putative (di)nucleoside polyphosphate hydrolase
VSGHTVSCGVLLVNRLGELLLCHVTHGAKWDIPKGMQDPGETTRDAALRELREETGIVLAGGELQELGEFAYRPAKRLHLYRAEAGEALATLGHLACSSYFAHRVTGAPTPEVDGFRWAGRADIDKLCWPRMAALLLSLDW